MPDRADALRAFAGGALALADRLDAGETIPPSELLEVLLPGMDALLQLAEAGIVPMGMPPAASLLEALGRTAQISEAETVPEDVWSCGECSELVTETPEGWRGLVLGSLYCGSDTPAAYFNRRHAVDRSHRG